MKKKFIFFVFCTIITFINKAQITGIAYPSGFLTEEKITTMLENSRKTGTQEWEVQKLNSLLHRQLEKQNSLTPNYSLGQKLIQAQPHITTVGCSSNAGFENGNTTDWVLQSGDINTVNLPCNACANTSGALSSVVTSTSTALGVCTNGIDNCSGLPIVAPAPLGGNYSLLLNNNSTGGKIESASQTFVVNSSNATYAYQFMYILENAGHPTNQNPYFSVNIIDSATNTIIPCSQYLQSASLTGNAQPAPSNGACSDAVIMPWTTMSLDLSAYMGHTLTIQFVVSDCNQGGHYGYCYIDAACNPGSTTNPITTAGLLCNGGSTVLYGPSNMATYNWAGPVSDTTKNLTTGTPGSYTLTGTLITGCAAPAIYYNLTQSATQAPSINITAVKDSVCKNAIDTLTASGATTYTWYNGATTNNISVSPTNTTTYSVTGLDTNTHCANTALQTIYVVQNLYPLHIQALHDSICNGNTDVLTASGGGTATSYTWNASIGGSSNANPLTISPSASATYTLTAIDSVYGCLNSIIKTIYVLTCSGINQLNNTGDLTIYPTPNNGLFSIESSSSQKQTLQLFDINGKLVLTQNLIGKTNIDASSLSGGIYNVVITSGNGVINKKLVIVK